MYTIQYNSGNHMLEIKREDTHIALVYHIVDAFRVIKSDEEHAASDVTVTQAAAEYAATCTTP